MAFTPNDIAQQALDAAGIEYSIGDMEDGSRVSQVLLRAYRQDLMQLLRSANWDFARKTAPLTLLADATGQTQGVGSLVPVGPFIYEYAYPTDAAKVRFIPWNISTVSPGAPAGNIQIPTTVPQTTGTGQPPLAGQRLIPSRFTVAIDPNYPPPGGAVSWEVQGVSPQGRTVILSNVKNAQCVYTAIVFYPSVWDVLFRAAFVAYLASEIAFPLHKDKKFGLQVRDMQIKIAKEKIQQARLADGNEGWYSSDIPVDWVNARSTGYGFAANSWGYGAASANIPGGWGGGWDMCGFADGSSY